jgi:glycyl-tRNA synthetase
MPVDRIESVVSLAKRRGFVYPSSEIYGGSRSAWDYGPLGIELKENIRRLWWRAMVQERDDIVGLDSAIVLARQVWVASGHVAEFVDPSPSASPATSGSGPTSWRMPTRRSTAGRRPRSPR